MAAESAKYTQYTRNISSMLIFGDAVRISTQRHLAVDPATFLILYHLPAPSLWSAHTPFQLLHPQLLTARIGLSFATGELQL